MPYKEKGRKIPGTNWIVRCIHLPILTDRERFDIKYKIVESGCWEWQGAISDTGYGALTIKGKTIHAHRYSYQINIGDIPKGMFICHKCDNRKCVNPNHFFLGTNGDNMLDAREKGRMPTAKCPSRTSYNNGCRCDGCKELARLHGRKMYWKNKGT